MSNVVNTSRESNSDDASKKVTISFLNIITYFGGSSNKTSIQDGEEIVSAGWVHANGIPLPLSRHHIVGFVVRTSSMWLIPHEVTLNNIIEACSSWLCRCSCKAGEGRKCKQIAACLIYIYRNPLLQRISCTDIKQKWGKCGKKLVQKYSAVRASEMCHCRKKVCMRNDIVTEEKQREYMEKILKVSPNCELHKLIYGNRSTWRANEENQLSDEFLKFIMDHDGLAKFIPYMEKKFTPQTLIHFSKITKTLDEAIRICGSTSSQTSTYWLTECNLRITGSNSYALYTYASNKTANWDKKLQNIYEGSFKRNDAMRYGQYAEQIAKKEISKGCLLFQTGLKISLSLPFLAYSADGISFDGDEWKLVEIKSPVKGREIEAKHILGNLPYLYFKNNNYHLSEKHIYYGQIQLGFAITNLKNCDLIIFCIKNNTFETIKVARNDNFIQMYISKLTEVYFTYVMPFLFKYS